MAQRPLRFLVRLAGAVLALGLFAVLARATFGWIYPVGSGSMEPLIRTGEWVTVRYGAEELGRYDCLVFRDEFGPGASIKMVAGLEFERVRVDAAGDLRIDDSLQPRDPRRPAPVPVFDSALQPVTGAWSHGNELFDPWERVGPEGRGEEWRLDASAVGRGADLGLMRFLERVDDGYLGADGTRVHGRHTVHDVVVEFDAFVERGGGYLRVQVTEQGDVFEAFINVAPGGGARDCYLSRSRMRVVPGSPPGDPVVVASDRRHLAMRTLEVPTGRWVRVRLANVDNLLRFELDGTALEYDYDAERNTPHWNSPDGTPLSTGPRAAIGGTGIEMRVRNLRVLRDFHVVPEGRYGVEGPLLLGEGEVFVLGFASGTSSDSRDRGPVGKSRVIGRAGSVVWPLGARRDL